MKRFALRQERSAMKIGTDGTLLGAIGGDKALETGAKRILDIGTGTGLIALMTAQKVEGDGTRIIGIEKDPEAAAEAAENVSQSPFASFIEILEGDFLDYSPAEPFDLILSNPPFFTATHRAPDERRTEARHIGSLTPESLFLKAAGMLSPKGQILVIYPVNMSAEFEGAATASGLYLNEKTLVRTVPGKEPKRSISAFAREMCPFTERELLIRDASGDYAPAYRALLAPFLTIF